MSEPEPKISSNLRAHLRNYRGSDPIKRARTLAFNDQAIEIVNFIKKDFRESGEEGKTYHFYDIAAKLGMDIETVREAVSDGGTHGITITVQE